MVSKKNMKKIIFVLNFLMISVFSFSAGENYYDYKALLVGDTKGNIIKEDNINTVRPLASVTKIMTSIITMEKIRNREISMEDKVTVSSKAASVPYGIKLVAGRQYTVRDLLKATIIKSSNNAAYALAEYVSDGDVERFIREMNNKAKKWELNSLRFCSPHGLPPSYTGSCMDQGNAKDLYQLALKTVEYKEYLDISRSSIDYIDGGEIKVTSTNTLLGKVGGVDGLKTGYHKAAGSNIILTAQRKNERVIVVILGSNKAKNRNAIGAREIDNYFLNGGSRGKTSSSSSNSSTNIKKENPLKTLWTGITSKLSPSNKEDADSNKSKKVIDSSKVVKTIKIENEKYSLYPAEDIIIKGQAGNRKINYKITLNENISGKDKGKVVGQYSADDGINEFVGLLVMR